jgi:hypothetical protein
MVFHRRVCKIVKTDNLTYPAMSDICSWKPHPPDNHTEYSMADFEQIIDEAFPLSKKKQERI